jgi:drug/metabolite transporter (DMT)-like permease
MRAHSPRAVDKAAVKSDELKGTLSVAAEGCLHATMPNDLLNSNRKRTLAFAALVIVMVVWGSTFVVTKGAMREFPPFTLAFLRFAIASLCLLIWMRGWRRIAALRQSVSFRRLAFLALTGVALFTVGFNYALLYGSASQGALIYATTPAVVAVCGALFLKERLHLRTGLGIALSIAGAVTIALAGTQQLDSAPTAILGAALMFFTVLLWGVYTVVAKQAAHADQLAFTFALSTLAALLLLPATVVELAMRGTTATSEYGWLGVLYLGIFASAGCYALYNFSLRELDASTVGVYTNIDPVVGVACAFVFLGETLSAAQAVGAAVVFAGIWLASVATPHSANKEPIRS